MNDLDRLTTVPKYSKKLNAAIEAVQKAQELGVEAMNESNLSEEEKDMAFAALGFDTRPSKLICVLNRPRSERLRAILEYGIDIGDRCDFV